MRNIKILWLSDIHYCETFKNEDELNNYLITFENFVSNNRYDFIILSGDIGNKGQKNDYEIFTSKFNKVLNDYKGRILAVPGNHDVNRNIAKALLLNNYDKIISAKSAEILYILSDEFTKSEMANDVFGEYKAFFNDKLDYNNGLDLIFENKSKLYKFLVNHEKKIIFILINSSIFSISEPSKGIKSNPNTIFNDDGKIFSEYGNQVYLCKDLINDIAIHFKDNNDYLKIGVAHHPPSWLHWTEQYTPGPRGTSKIQDLFENIDLLLVGHEHVHPIPGEFIYGKTMMLKGVRFMGHTVQNLDTEILNNGFKVISILGNKLEEKSYFYLKNPYPKFDNIVNIEYNLQWLSKMAITYPSDKDVLIDSESHVNSSVKTCSKEQAIHYFNKKYKKNYNMSVMDKAARDYFILENSDEIRLVCLSRKFLWQDNCEPEKDVIDLLSDIYKNNSGKSVILSLIEEAIYDIPVDELTMLEVINGNFEVNEYTFDKFRQNFFEFLIKTDNFKRFCKIKLTYNLIY